MSNKKAIKKTTSIRMYPKDKEFIQTVADGSPNHNVNDIYEVGALKEAKRVFKELDKDKK